jgi:hypothetical protein
VFHHQHDQLLVAELFRLVPTKAGSLGASPPSGLPPFGRRLRSAAPPCFMERVAASPQEQAPGLCYVYDAGPLEARHGLLIFSPGCRRAPGLLLTRRSVGISFLRLVPTDPGNARPRDGRAGSSNEKPCQAQTWRGFLRCAFRCYCLIEAPAWYCV